jgi:CubicO group peptidase (beta-lactamase class C family)
MVTMKKTIWVLLFGFYAGYLLAQTGYTREIEEQIRLVENSLAGRVKIKGNETSTLAERMDFYHVKGLSIAVVKDYKVIWAKGYGWADVETKKPVTTETLFEPGSISKSLNAMGVLKLVQDKKLDLHTDINSYLTSWQFPYDEISKNKKITLAHLLSHSAGLGVHGFPGYDLLAPVPTVPQVLDGASPANTPAVRSLFEPGLRFQYSGGGTTISQLIIADITNQPYDEFMYENVLKPIGMVNSFYTQPPPLDKRHLCATGYHPDGSAVPNRFHVYPEQGAAGLWMTPTDLCQYIIETQLAYEGKSAKVLNQEMTTLGLTPYNDPSAALGVFIDDRNGTLYFQHSAGNEGFCGQYYGSMQGGNGVAIFLNTDREAYALIPEVLNSVATVYEWKGYYEPVYKTAIDVKDKTLQKYIGVYQVDGKALTHIVKQKDGYYLCADGMASKMYFSSETDFFNIEFSSEKHFVTDASGHVTGYLRSYNGEELPDAKKVLSPDTLNGDAEMFNAIGWSLLEQQEFETANQYLKRGLQLYPTHRWIEGNLAHSYLFNGDYKAALAIYAAHMGETLNEEMTWEDMISRDFVFFKGRKFDTKPMDKILAELKLDIPPGYKD